MARFNFLIRALRTHQRPGFNILREIEMTNRSLVIVGASLAAGLGVTFIPDALTGFPEQLRSVLESGISVGSLCALILNLVLPN